jgi:site-specific DNA-methyltransferase (cytosine-N4-specific)
VRAAPKLTLLEGDATQLLRTLPEASVHCCVTSPPYFQLRSYGGATAELGGETRVDDYVSRLVDVFAEVRRVLHPSGVLWLNLGDSYGRDKQLLGVPWRVAFALQDDGWLLRSETIWHKTSCKPENVSDRPARAHETVFLFAKQPRYFYDAEAVREPASGPGAAAGATRVGRSVWSLPATKYPGAHCAVMPTELAERCVLAGSSAHGCCRRCGAPYRRLVELGEQLDGDYLRYCGANKDGGTNSRARKDFAAAKAQDASAMKARILARMCERKTVGWEASCTCDVGPTTPAVVLDPFCGAGTSGLVALEQGRSFVGVELYRENIEETRTRLAGLASV